MKLCRLFLIAGILPVFSNSAMAASNYPPPPNVRLTFYPQLNNEEQVWICPTDSNIIIADWRDFRLGYRQVGIGRSTDGGLTWNDSLISFDMQVSPGGSWQSDPTLTVDRLGNFYISVLDYDPFSITDHSFIAFYKSTDKGISWTGPVLHLPVVDATVFEDKQFTTIDRTGGLYDGHLYCSWTRFVGPIGQVSGPVRMMFVRSIDGAASFQDTILFGNQIVPPECGGGLNGGGQFSIPVVAANGDLHLFWMGFTIEAPESGCIGYEAIMHVLSTDGGQTFTFAESVAPISGWSMAMNGTNIYSNPAADADISGGPFDGNIYIAFTNYGPEDVFRSDIDFIRSTDNAVSWSGRLQINDDATAPVSDSYHPWLIVNEEGVVIVIFYDTRYDSPSHLLFDLMAAYSFDGGETFTSNHRISSVSSDAGNLKINSPSGWQAVYDDSGHMKPPVISPRAGLIGEYIGVTAFHDKINAVWTDSRDGNSEVYTANWYLPILEPRLIAPIDNSFANANPTFRWATSWKHNEDRYRLEISDNPSFAIITQTHLPDTNFFTPIIDIQEGTWYWRIKTLTTDGLDSSAYSATGVFQVDNTPPESPQLLSPEDGLVTFDPAPIFDWSEVTKSGTPVVYDLYFSTDATFPIGPLTTVISGLSISAYIPVDPLPVNNWTYWKVRARDLAGNASGSEVRSVKYITFICGDINNDLLGPNILDLNYLVNYIFRGGPLPPIIAASDLNGSGGNPNIVDLNIIVNRIFRGGSLPTCAA